MRPHVLHSSGKLVRHAHRRVVHLEYSDYVLPQGIHWAQARAPQCEFCATRSLHRAPLAGFRAIN